MKSLIQIWLRAALAFLLVFGCLFNEPGHAGMLPSGQYPYYNGTGLASDLFAQTANIASTIGNSVDAVGSTLQTILGIANTVVNDVGDGCMDNFDAVALVAVFRMKKTKKTD